MLTNSDSFPWLLDSNAAKPGGACPWCSGLYSWTAHSGACPKIKAIEYHPDGTVKRIEFRGEGE